MSTTCEVSIIIANYNTAHYLSACLTSIKETAVPGLDYEIIVVDNASSDGSVELVRTTHSDVILITNNRNAGFSAANNQGIGHSRGRLLLFLNPDTIVHPNTIQTMLRFVAERPDVGAATCRVELPNGQLDDGAHRGFPTPWNALCYFSGASKLLPRSKLVTGYVLSWMDMETVHEIDALVGAFMLVRREAGDAVGWWDEDYFFYGEDLDFCFNLKHAGWKIMYVPDVSITHHKGASAGIKKQSAKVTTASKETRVQATRARFEAMRIFYQKHYVNSYPRVLTDLVFRAIDVKERFAVRRL